MIKINTYYDYNIDNVFEEGNVVGDVLKTRGALAQNPEAPITRTDFTIAYTNRPFIWMRKPGIKGPEVEIKDENVWFYTPLMEDEDRRGKENSRFILHTDTAAAAYYYQSDKIKEAVEFVDSPKNDPESQEFKDKRMIVQCIHHGPYNALLRLLKSKTDKKIEIIGNDVTIEGKKVSGGFQHYNSTGTHHQMGVNYLLDGEFFKKILSDDEYHRATGQGITSIVQEIPGYGREEFTEEWANELRKIMSEARFYL